MVLRVCGVLLVLVCGCTTSGYLTQAAAGQLELLRRARPLEESVRDPSIDPRVRELLAWVPVVKAWGSARGLRPTRNYERYADLGRPAAVWVVQACQKLAFEPRRWSFPVVGSVPYLGFFEEERARALAESIAREEDLDVDVRTARAYSTLGWFRDPVLSTMIGSGPEALGDLVNVVLHECVHATVYVANQSPLNEGLATFVADRLTLEWFSQHGTAESKEAKAWVAAEARQEASAARLRQARAELGRLYASGASSAEKLAEKARVLEKLSQDLRVSRRFNNASLAGFATYWAGREAFARLFEACGKSWPRLLSSVQSLRPSDFSASQQAELDDVVEGLAQRGCPPGRSGARRAPLDW